MTPVEILRAALEDARESLIEAANILRAANIGGTPLHGSASLMEASAERVRRAIALAEEEEQP